MITLDLLFLSNKLVVEDFIELLLVTLILAEAKNELTSMNSIFNSLRLLNFSFITGPIEVSLFQKGLILQLGSLLHEIGGPNGMGGPPCTQLSFRVF